MASGFPSAHQRKLGPAPIASFEDLSDEVENGGEAASAGAGRMPGIVEVTTPVTPAGSSLKTPSTPRIDISRASSSSHHEEDSNSRESTPEKELLAGNAPPEGCKLQLGYKEDATDLRSSTEELDLQDPVHEQDLKRDAKRARRRARELHDGTQSEHGISIKLQGASIDRERKDSNCSEIILLNISGRTSRLSSVGSQGSGVSGGALSVVSATSSSHAGPRKKGSPSPHKCLLETSFCGSVSTLSSTLIEPSKPETDDLAKILLQREEDSTRAMIPESVRVPIVGGNLKPDPLDAPRRRGREERKEMFRREVEITKRVLKKVNIEVPIIKLQKEPSEEEAGIISEPQKPASLDLERKRSPSDSSRAPAIDTPKPPRHQKIRDLEGSRTPSPSSVSRKSSFTSLFKGRVEGSSVQDSPTTTSSRRTSLASRLKDTAESLRSRSKSRERPSSGDKSPGKRPESRSRGGSGIFSSTLSLFKKRERKKSADSSGTPDTLDGSHGNLDSIGCVEFTFNQQQTPSRPKKEGDVIFISLYGENDEFRYKSESEPPPPPASEEPALPSESVDLSLDDPEGSSPQQSSANIIRTDATIEHHRRSRRSDRRSRDAAARISSSSGESTKIPESHSRDSRIALDDGQFPATADGQAATESLEEARNQRMSASSSRDSLGSARPEVVKPRRKSKKQSSPSAAKPPLDPSHSKQPEMNGKLSRQPAVLVLPGDPLWKAPSLISDLDRNSSESDHDSEIDFIRNKAEKGLEEVPVERKGLCYEESFEEDLPYVPTTLPLEKSAVLPMLPVKQRLQEVTRTTPIERPRSTTPINPSLLDEFIMHTSTHEERERRRKEHKMKISLPREDSFKLKSPHRLTTQNSFSEFAGRVPTSRAAHGLSMSPSPPPPLPPRAPTTVLTTVPPGTTARPANWINFEEIPEKRKAPKRIQTIPRLEDDAKHSQTGAANVGQYSYVQPEECRCECHEESRRASLQRDGQPRQTCNGENCQGAEGAGQTRSSGQSNGASSSNADRASIASDNSSLECSLSAEYGPDNGSTHHQSGSNGGLRPFAMDLDVSSNRSSIISQEETEDEHQ